jgi:hypothetical protein
LKLAIILAHIALIIGISWGCKKTETPRPTESVVSEPKNESLTALVLFTVGKVSSEQMELKQGDIIEVGKLIETGPKSMCDLQVLEHEAEVVIRIKPNSNFLFGKNSDTKVINSTISQGSAMFKVSKPLKRDEKVQIASPTFVAGVRGTEFGIEVSKTGDSKLKVVSGAVSTRVRIPELEDLESGGLDQTEEGKKILADLETSAVTLEKGQTLQISTKEKDSFIKTVGLDDAVKEIQLAKKSNSEIKLNDVLKDKSEPETVTKGIEKWKAPKISTIANKDLNAEIKEFEKLIAIESAKVRDPMLVGDELKKFNKERQEVLIKKIEEITGKSSETLVLKDGRKIQGVIYQEGNTYIVLSPEGKQSFNETEVEGTEF